MISFFDNSSISFNNMGLFYSPREWIHPEISCSTYEIIFVVKGVVYIEEGGKEYALSVGEMLCLKPMIMHRGYKKSSDVSFFWLHFSADNFESFGTYYKKINDSYKYSALFTELNHLSIISRDKTLIECKMLEFFLEIKNPSAEKNKLFSDASEFIRVNIQSAPSVAFVANKFGYSPDYLSKVFIKCAGIPLKKYIDRERNAFVKNLLLTSSMSVKEIAAIAHFEDDNALTKFFIYNNSCSPSSFRNSYYASHTNIQ